MIGQSSPAVLGFAGCSSVGYSVEATLAAMGAGLNNFAETGVPDEFGSPTAAAALLDAAAPRAERLAALARLSAEELQPFLSQIGAPRLPVLVGCAADLEPHELQAMAVAWQEPGIFDGEVAWISQGRASGFAALAQASEWLETGAHRLVAVGGIDSLCATSTIEQLVSASRVLGPHTEGAIPGEAAAFVILARSDDPLVDATAAIRLEHVIQHRAADPWIVMKTVDSDDLTHVFRLLRERGVQRVNHVVAAHSGEGYFGRTFAQAYLREPDVFPEPLDVELTADRLGDVGAAAVILGLAFGSFLMAQSGKGARRSAMVYSESDTGEIGAAIIAGAPTTWRRAVRHGAGLQTP